MRFFDRFRMPQLDAHARMNALTWLRFKESSSKCRSVNLTIAAIILWNTVYLGHAIADLRAQGHGALEEHVDVGGSAAHQAFHGIDGALGLREQPVARSFSDNDASVGIKTDDRRTQCAAIRPGNTLRLARLRICVRNETVGSAKIDSDDASHSDSLCLSQFFGNVDNQVADVRAAIEQIVQSRHQLLASGIVRVCVNCGVPVAGRRLKLGVDFG